MTTSPEIIAISRHIAEGLPPDPTPVKQGLRDFPGGPSLYMLLLGLPILLLAGYVLWIMLRASLNRGDARGKRRRRLEQRASSKLKHDKADEVGIMRSHRSTTPISNGVTMKPDELVRELYEAGTNIPEPFSSLNEEEQRLAEELLQRFENAKAARGALPFEPIVYPMLLSKAGRYEEALSLTEQSYRASPDWSTAIAAANAARRAGDLDRAITMFAKGAEHDPDDVTCWLEIGDIHLESDRFAEALTAYERVLAVDERHAWALPSAFYCRDKLSIEGNWRGSLHELVNQEGCTCGLEGCLTEMFGGYGSGQGIARAEYLLAK